MGDNTPRDRANAAEISSIGNGKKVHILGKSMKPDTYDGRDVGNRNVDAQVVDSMSAEWTDEKHKSYLNSIEASFVKQLYSSEHGSNDLLGLSSKAKIHTNSSASSKNQSFSQFKVQRKGCWENLKFERANSQAENDSESLRLCESTWIQHFRTHSTNKEPLITSAHQKDNSKVVAQSVHLTNRRYASEATSSKQLTSFCSQKVHKVSIGSITEVSDQNFVDIKDGRGEELNRRNGKKRGRSVVSPITDQVVPFVTPSSEEKAASVKENNEECSRMNVENAGNSF